MGFSTGWVCDSSQDGNTRFGLGAFASNVVLYNLLFSALLYSSLHCSAPLLSESRLLSRAEWSRAEQRSDDSGWLTRRVFNWVCDSSQDGNTSSVSIVIYSDILTSLDSWFVCNVLWCGISALLNARSGSALHCCVLPCLVCAYLGLGVCGSGVCRRRGRGC
jgi:hypothetical protein